MPRTKWIVLGSGGGEAAPERTCPGHLLETPETLILFDCGDGITGSFLRMGKRVEDLDAIFISHTHPDHVCGLSFFLQQMYLAVRRRELVIYLPEEAIAGIKSYFELSYLFLDRFPFPIAFTPLVSGEPITWRDITIIPHRNTHLTRHCGQPWAAGLNNRGECFSFELHIQGKKIGYSADVGSLDDLAFCAGADLLVSEVTHISFPELIHRAEVWRVERVLLVHLGPEFNPAELPLAQQTSNTQMIISADGTCIPLDA